MCTNGSGCPDTSSGEHSMICLSQGTACLHDSSHMNHAQGTVLVSCCSWQLHAAILQRTMTITIVADRACLHLLSCDANRQQASLCISPQWLWCARGRPHLLGMDHNQTHSAKELLVYLCTVMYNGYRHIIASSAGRGKQGTLYQVKLDVFQTLTLAEIVVVCS